MYFIVDLDGSAVAKFEHARANDFVARVHPGNNGHLVALRTFDLDELLADAAVGSALLVFEIGDDEDRIAIRCITNRRRRQRDHRTACAQSYLYLNEHAGPQFTLWVRECGLDLDIAGCLVHYRIERRDAAGEHPSGQILAGDSQAAANSYLPECLLRKTHIDIDPAARYCPRFALRIPKIPEKGARMVLRSIVAWISATFASVAFC